MNEATHTPQAPAEESSSQANALSNPGRRRLTGIGLGVPVVLTLASRPAFGGQCLSNMMSGNLSAPDRGHCSRGWSPGAWKNTGGTINGLPTLSAWTKAGCVYGTAKKVDNAWTCTGGTLLTTAGITAPSGTAPKNTLSEALLNYPSSIQFHVVAAWLNAKLSEADANYQYILTPQQVLDLASGAIPLPPGYQNLKSFLDSTWT